MTRSPESGRAVAASATPLPASLTQVWERLAAGHDRVVDNFVSETSCGLMLHPTATPEAGVFGRQRFIVESLLRGACQNCIAIDLMIASSTVALYARLGLERLGVDAKPSRVPAMLMLLASVADDQGNSRPALIEPNLGTGGYTVHIPRPDLCLRDLLPPAEHEAVKLMFEGNSYAEIAQRRGTATRTTANQLAAAFRRLTVSGRSQLIRRSFVLAGWLPNDAPAPPQIARAS